MTPEEFHGRTFGDFMQLIQTAGIEPRTCLLRGTNWRIVVVRGPMRTYTVTCDSASGHLSVHFRRLLRSRLVMQARLTSESFAAALAQAAACIVTDTGVPTR